MAGIPEIIKYMVIRSTQPTVIQSENQENTVDDGLKNRF